MAERHVFHKENFSACSGVSRTTMGRYFCCFPIATLYKKYTSHEEKHLNLNSRPNINWFDRILPEMSRVSEYIGSKPQDVCLRKHVYLTFDKNANSTPATKMEMYHNLS